MEYPLFDSKALSDGNIYKLNDRVERMKYFHAKLGSKIDDIKSFLESSTFIGFLLAKKQAGKGTYAKMIGDILGTERFVHISVGDVVRNTHTLLSDPVKFAELEKYLKDNYRGMLSIEESLQALKDRSTDKVCIPTEFLLCLLKKEVETVGRKALFVDGLPRNMDQISYSLYFRDLINFRNDPDFFVLINVPREMIDARMKWRRVCPICQTSRNLLFNPTNFIRYNEDLSNFELLCDNKDCSGYSKQAYVTKEGDSRGIALIEDRLKDDEELMKTASKLQGIPKIFVESSVPYRMAAAYLEDYEIQPMIEMSHVGKDVTLTQKPWLFRDDNGVECCTTYAATYVVNILTQIHKILIG